MSVEKLTTIYSQHTVFLQRVGAGHGLAVTPYLERIQEGMNLIFLRNSGKNPTQARLVRIQQQINELTRKELQGYVNWLKVQNREIGANESSFAASSLDSVVKSDVDIETPSSAQVNALAVAAPIQMGEKSWTTYNTMMKNYREKYTDEIDSIVAVGFASGQTIEQMSRDIMNQIVLTSSDNTGNVLTRARKSAKSLAITGTNHYANQARIAFVDQNDELLTGYRLIAVVDSRTSQKCRALDQKVIKKDNPKLSNFTPPLHRNCRTAMVYEVDQRFRLDDSETQRASSFEVDGKRDPKPISSEGIYYGKMAKLNKADQDNILGPTLGKAFRKLDNPEAFAKATIDRLGNPLSIKEMKRRDNALSEILRGQKPKAKTVTKSVVKKPTVLEGAAKSIPKINKANNIKAPKGVVNIKQSTAGAIPKSIAAKSTLNKQLSGDESAYVEYYKGDGFYKSNDILRNPSKYSQGEIDSAIKMREAIDSAISKSTLDNDAFVYRGIRDNDLFSVINVDSIGAELSIDTAQSVAKDARIALNYSGAIKINNDYLSANKEAVVFKIKVKKGQNALDMETLTGVGNTSESELLLSSSGKYKITGIQERFAPNGDLSLKIIEVDYVD